MMKQLTGLLLLFVSFSASAQTAATSPEDDLRVLIELNSHTENYVDLSGKESISLSANTDAAKVIAITAPYLQSQVLHAKDICLHFLGETLFKKSVTDAQQKEIINIICKDFLNRDQLDIASNILLNFKRTDFSPEAQKNISKLIDSLPYLERDRCAKLFGLLQIKKSIPALWMQVNKDIPSMGSTDIVILAALARMDENEAAELLCKRYKYVKNNEDRQVYIAQYMAFSLHPAILKCLIRDFNTIDLDKNYRDGDVFINPGHTLGTAITWMLKNYPYEKREFRLEPKQLFGWLNKTKQYELGEK